MTSALRDAAARPAARRPAPARGRRTYHWLQGTLIAGSLAASLVGARGLQRAAERAAAATLDPAQAVVVAVAPPVRAPSAPGALPAIGDLPALELAPIPTVPAIQPRAVRQQVAPVARSRSSR
jgi:hypothetical protein